MRATENRKAPSTVSERSAALITTQGMHRIAPDLVLLDFLRGRDDSSPRLRGREHSADWGHPGDLPGRMSRVKSMCLLMTKQAVRFQGLRLRTIRMNIHAIAVGAPDQRIGATGP